MKKTNKPDALKSIDIKALMRSRGIYDQMETNKILKEAAMPFAKEMIRHKFEGEELIADHPEADAIKEYVDKQLHLIHVVEDKFNNKLQQFITKMVDGYLKTLEAELATTKKFKNKSKDYFSDNEDELMQQAQLDFTPLLDNLGVLAGQEALKMINSKDVYISNLRKQVAANVSKFTQSLIDTDREHLVDLITNGIKEGASIPEIRDIIQADFDNITKSQAERITKTEVSRVSIQSAKDAWQQSGVVEALQWVVVAPVDECADYDGEVRALDDSGGFYDIQNDFQDGDPPLHPNCQCQLIPIVIDSGQS